MEHVTGLKCTICGKTYAPGEVEYVCPDHGNDGNLDVQYNYELIADRLQEDGLLDVRGIWRYKALLPIAYNAPTPPLLVGDTPLYRADNVAKEIGVGKVWIKDDGRNPTASLKDRASALLV
ncbi:MAG: pyridoxal-phosphate dependent enzyme, partial [Chloroflexi bacterium]|nr:pyridoxal-phosphate dependent enzyme [Chloroflexota bacterium]